MVLGCVHLPAWPWLPRKPGDLALLISRPHVASLALRDPPPKSREGDTNKKWGKTEQNVDGAATQETQAGEKGRKVPQVFYWAHLKEPPKWPSSPGF